MSRETSYVFFEKPTKHVSVPDWKAQVNDFRLLSEDKRQQATVLRSETSQLRNETVIASSWQRHNTNNLLVDRIEEGQEWMQLLENARRLLKNESNLLSEEKQAAEMEIEDYYRKINVVSECFFIRDHEILIDLSYDDPYKELNKERELLENSRSESTDMCHEAWELVNEADALLNRLHNNLNDKQATVDVDTQALEIGKDCEQHVGHKPNPEREPQGIIGHDAWIQQNQSLVADSERLSSLSSKLRERIRLFRDQTRMRIRGQIETTNFALRKRLYDANRLKNELEWQRKNALEEMDRLRMEIDRLNACAAELDYTLKCAETRQENRNNRLIGQLSRDSAHEGLIEEIVKLRQNLRDVREKIDLTICTYNKVENLVVQLDKEIACKAVCIDTEMRAMDARVNLLPKEDFKNVLGKLEDQISKPPIC